MESLKDCLCQLEQRYQKIENVIRDRQSNVLPGRLEVHESHGKTHFQLIVPDPESKQDRRVYIKSTSDLIPRYAQKSYDLAVERLIKKRLEQIRRFEKMYREDELLDIYERLHPARRQHIQPFAYTMEQWLAIPYPSKKRPPESNVYITNQGEKTRSKTEKILADTFSLLHIPYKYEFPLSLHDGRTVYPDFTFFNPYTQKQIYWEHDGLMDDPNYRAKAIAKIRSYELNGIFRGQNLIVTYELNGKGLDQQWIEALIEAFLTPCMKEKT